MKKMQYIILVLILSSCGMKLDGVTEPQSYSFNGVKLIRPEVTRGDDLNTMLREEYEVSQQSRLLLRFEEFLSKVDSISLGNDRQVSVLITLNEGQDLNQAKTDLLLCPLTSNWMMLATWYKAYPMGRTGNWKTLGGDIESADCVQFNKVENNTLQFDVTSWVKNYAIGRNQNFGFMLTVSAGNRYLIHGDLDSTGSPRIEWIKYQ